MQAKPGWFVRHPSIPYIAPTVVFAVLGQVERHAGVPYTLAYTIKVVAVTATLIACRSTWRDVRPNVRVVLPGVLVGLAVLAEWILLSKYVPYPRIGARVAFNPLIAISDPAHRVAFITVRLLGLSLMVPLMEELFWRSYLVRMLSQHEWSTMPIGTFSWSAFWLTALAFGAVHPEWLVAVVCGVAYGLLLWRTRSVFACIVAHGVTNLGLGIYVLLAHAWVFW